MQMKVVIPDGGIYSDGVSYSAGTMVVRDMNTLRGLLAHGARMVDDEGKDVDNAGAVRE